MDLIRCKIFFYPLNKYVLFVRSELSYVIHQKNKTLFYICFYSALIKMDSKITRVINKVSYCSITDIIHVFRLSIC